MKIRRQVEDAMRNGYQNGYDISKWSPEKIAADMIERSADFEDCHPTDLIPHILRYLGG